MSVSTNKKLLAFFKSKGAYNTLTARQAEARFGVKNLSAHVAVLRNEGHAIYTNRKTLADGRKITFYRLGKPSKRYVRNMRAGRTQIAIATLYSRAA